MPKLLPVTPQELVKIIAVNNKLPQIFRDIKGIDKDSNGYILVSELNKIFKAHYFKELEGKSLNKVSRPYGSIQNKQLIDYKKFNIFLLREVRDVSMTKAEEEPKAKEAHKEPAVVEAPPKLPNLIEAPRDKIGSPGSPNRIDDMKNQILANAYETYNQQMNPGSTRNAVALKKSATQGVLGQLGNTIIKPGQLQPLKAAPSLTGGLRDTVGPDMSPRGMHNKYRTLDAGSNSPMARSQTHFSNFRSNVPGSPSNGPSVIDMLKQKLAYEWKNVFRSLAAIDLNSNGFVTKTEF